MLHARGILVDREDLATFAQQVNEVAPVSASGVKHAHAGLNVAAQDLIEDVDIDLAELLLNVQGHSVPILGFSIAALEPEHCTSGPLQCLHGVSRQLDIERFRSEEQLHALLLTAIGEHHNKAAIRIAEAGM